jgi:hypothetical protein
MLRAPLVHGALTRLHKVLHIIRGKCSSGKRRCASYNEEHKTHAPPPGALPCLHAFMKMSQQPCKNGPVT